MDKITEFCTGCRTCEQLCPTNSISIRPDHEGFLEPVIDKMTCIDCGLCSKRCPQNKLQVLSPSQNVYGFRYKDSNTLYHSASGGAFVALAKYILEQNGVVYGSVYVDQNMHVCHVRVDDLKDLKRLQGSKYVQSDTQHTFNEVLLDLKEGLKVLYSGTPCQIAGLKSYLNKNYDTLVTVDIICHGVPSPLLFEKYILWMSNKYSKIIEYNFRDKKGGWGLTAMASTKTKIIQRYCNLDPYYFHFLEGNTYRESCYKCQYARAERVSDITIGDYWGIEDEHPEFYSEKGVSCVLINTTKGEEIFKKIKDKAICIESTLEKVSHQNGNLNHPTNRNSIRDYIYNGINDKGLNDFFSDNMKFKIRFVDVIKSHVPSQLKIYLKKVLK